MRNIHLNQGGYMIVTYKRVLSDSELDFYKECAEREGIPFAQWLKQMINGEF